METRGRILNVSREIMTNKLHITFVTDDVPSTELNRLSSENELSIIAKKYRKKRSLDANAYYWQLLSKIAEKLKTTTAFLHNKYLRECAVFDLVDDKAIYIVMPDTDTARNKIDEAMEYHLYPTSQVKPGKGDIMYRTYMMLKGSHEYDTKEMSRLIDSVVEDAKTLGIETLPQSELERLVASWRSGKT